MIVTFVRIVHFHGGLFLVNGTFDKDKPNDITLSDVFRMNLFSTATQTSYAVPNVTTNTSTGGTVYFSGAQPTTGSINITWVAIPSWERVAGWETGLSRKVAHELTIDMAKDNLAFTP